MAPKVSIKARNEQFSKTALQKPGAFSAKKQNKKDDKSTLSPHLVGLLIFIVCGSAVVGLLQVLLNAFLTPSQPEISPEMLQAYQAQMAKMQMEQQQEAGFEPLSNFPVTDDAATQDNIAITPDIENVDLDNEVDA